MTKHKPEHSSRGMSVWQRFRKLSIANQVAVITSIIAAFISFIGIGITVHYSQEQSELNGSVATFQAQIQTTADFQYSQQLSVQQTQIAMQSQMDMWARQQALPFVKVIIPPEHIFIVEKITSEETSSGYIITGSGLLEVAFANDGGANATVKTIDWINDVDTKSNLFILSVNSEGAQFPLPNTIEAQTPKRIKLNLEANVPYSGNPNGKSDYQLGEYWKKTLQSSPNHLAVTFSNTDTVNIQISDIQLAMPEVGFEPDPPSLFAVTNKTDLTVNCIDSDGKEVSLQITNLITKATTKTVLADGACNSYPVGDYEFVWKDENSKTQTKVLSLGGNNPSTISLVDSQVNIVDLIDAFWSSTSSVVLSASTLLIAFLFGFLSVKKVEQGVLNIYSRRNDALKPIISKEISIYPWGGKAKIRIKSELMEIMVSKRTKNSYLLKVLRNADQKNIRYTTTREISSEHENYLAMDVGEEDDLQISYHKRGT